MQWEQRGDQDLRRREVLAERPHVRVPEVQVLRGAQAVQGRAGVPAAGQPNLTESHAAAQALREPHLLVQHGLQAGGVGQGRDAQEDRPVGREDAGPERVQVLPGTERRQVLEAHRRGDEQDRHAVQEAVHREQQPRRADQGGDREDWQGTTGAAGETAQVLGLRAGRQAEPRQAQEVRHQVDLAQRQVDQAGARGVLALGAHRAGAGLHRPRDHQAAGRQLPQTRGAASGMYFLW